MRSSLALLTVLASGCLPAPRGNAPPLDLPAGLSSEGDLQIWWTDPGIAPGEEQDTELDDALVDLIDAATTSVDLALYEFDLPIVVDAIEDAWDRGVDVRMVGDGDEVHDAGYEALELAGIPIVSRPAGDRIMHHKFVVVDSQAVWTGSTNVSHNGLNRNNNHALIVRSSTLAQSYTWELEEMFGGEFGRGKTAMPGSRAVDLVDGTLQWHFSPTHDPIDVVVEAIDAAQYTAAFMVFSFTHADVVDALVRAQARGVDVVGIFDESQANGAWSADETLAAAGIPVLIDGNKNASGFSGGKLHHKVLVVDAGHADATVISGSMNWSNAGTSDNDENLLLLESPSVATEMMDALCDVLLDATLHPDTTAAVPDICDAEPVEPPDAQGVVINEVLSTPRHGDPVGAFVELVSVETHDRDLTGWTLRSASGHVWHTFDGDKLLAGQSLVLVDARSALSGTAGVVTADALHLSAVENLELVGPENNVVDAFPIAGQRPGESLGRPLDGHADGTPQRHSALTGDASLASPGRRADGRPWSMDAAPDLLVINELLPDPRGTDSGQEYVELVNAGPLPLDPTGFTLCDASGVCHTFGPPVLLPGQAMVLFDHGDHSAIPGARTSDAGRLSLNNGSDQLTLWAPDGTEHDTVAWTTSATGMAWNRAADADPEAGLVRHTDVEGATSDQSPGLRADGTDWR